VVVLPLDSAWAWLRRVCLYLSTQSACCLFFKCKAWLAWLAWVVDQQQSWQWGANGDKLLMQQAEKGVQGVKVCKKGGKHKRAKIRLWCCLIAGAAVATSTSGGGGGLWCGLCTRATARSSVHTHAYAAETRDKKVWCGTAPSRRKPKHPAQSEITSTV